MSLVFAGIASHAPGITGRANLVDPAIAQEFHGAYRGMAQRLAAARPDALIVVAAEHFANFFMNNMPSFAVGMADRYEGPIEDPQWLGIPHTSVPGSAALSRRLIRDMMQTVDLAYAEEWKFDHGIMVPLHFLTPRFDLPIVPMNINCQGPPLAPLHRAWAFGEALRRAADSVPERIGLVGTGGISHWPATPDSGKINEAWDLEFLRSLAGQRPAGAAVVHATRRPIATPGRADSRSAPSSRLPRPRAAAARCEYYRAIPMFAVGCTIADMRIGE